MTEDSPAPELEPLGSRYLLESPLGSGAMGQVWRATTRDGGPVAIKVLRPELSSDPGVVTRFLQERQILEGIADPHLVRVRDLVAEGAKLAIVMDLVEGPDLRSELVRRGTFRPIEAAEIVDGVLSGLAAVHAGGVVHRDVKPENVLLSGGLPSGVRLTDFGVARLVEEGQKSRRTTVIGTPDYLAPEVADGAEPTAASDLYAAGVLLYELVAGVTPFAGGSPLAVLRRHAEQQPVRPEGMPDAVWAAVSALLAKDPAQRPADAGQVRAQLAASAHTFARAPQLRPLETPPAPAVVAQPTVMGLRAETQVIDPAAAPAGPPPRKRRTGLLVAGIAVLVVLLVAGGITFVALNRGGDTAAAGETAAAGTTTTSSSSAARSTTARRSSTSTSATPSAGVVPAVTGLSLAQAQASLTNAGLRVQVTEVLDDTVTDNTVTAQDPIEGTSLERGGTVTLTVARRPVGVFLAGIAPVQGSDYNTGTATLNGQTYVRAVTSGTSCGESSTLQYDLGRNYRTFTTTVGPSDASVSQAVLQIDVVVDGRSVFTQQAKLGEPVAVNVDVTGGLRLALTATRVDPDCSIWDDDVIAVWGDPELFGAPGEVPTTPATTTN